MEQAINALIGLLKERREGRSKFYDPGVSLSHIRDPLQNAKNANEQQGYDQATGEMVDTVLQQLRRGY